MKQFEITPEMMKTAAEFGEKAHKSGLECLPYKDQEFINFIKTVEALENYIPYSCAKLYEVWNKSWVKANENSLNF